MMQLSCTLTGKFVIPVNPLPDFFCLVTANVVPWLYIAYIYCLHKLLQSAVLLPLLIQALQEGLYDAAIRFMPCEYLLMP